jgi:hypothetical protein
VGRGCVLALALILSIDRDGFRVCAREVK